MVYKRIFSKCSNQNIKKLSVISIFLSNNDGHAYVQCTIYATDWIDQARKIKDDEAASIYQYIRIKLKQGSSENLEKELQKLSSVFFYLRS